MILLRTRLRALFPVIGLCMALATAPATGQDDEQAAPSLASSVPEPVAAEPRITFAHHGASLTLGAGLILWYYQPLTGPARSNADVFFARLLIDGRTGIWGVHVEPRIRDARQRSFEDGPAFLQEAYVSANVGTLTLKAGKEYSRLGLFWDNSFYGNLQALDGLKLAPDYGLSFEAESRADATFSLDYALQYFIVDGRTNMSLPTRDIVSVPDARRRHSVVLRVDPRLSWGGVQLRVGLSGQAFQADLPDDEQLVLRAALDANLTLSGGFQLWAEFLVQDGRHVIDYPGSAARTNALVPNIERASKRNYYGLLGAQFAWQRVTLRLNGSVADYHDASMREWMVVPGFAVHIVEQLDLLLEYVRWCRVPADGPRDLVDQSLNFTLHARYQ
jgi:hypothetical protein